MLVTRINKNIIYIERESRLSRNCYIMCSDGSGGSVNGSGGSGSGGSLGSDSSSNQCIRSTRCKMRSWQNKCWVC